MSAASRLKFLHLAYASKPKEERFLYRAIRRRGIVRIVELGLTSLIRSRRLIEVAQRYAPSCSVSFTGIDLFEGAAPPPNRSDPPPWSLIEVFRTLKPTGAAVRLLPGPLAAVLPDAANSLPRTDLLLIAPHITDADLARVWFYLPRMLYAGSLVLRQKIDAQGCAAFEAISLSHMETLSLRRPRSAA